jgi:glycosyltransferase involved in cell wall biosynthesis
LRILNVVSVLSAREGGGNAERTVQMSRSLAQDGHASTVLTLDIGDPWAQQSNLGKASLEVIPCWGRRFQIPQLDVRRICRSVEQADVIHLMGYWSVLGVLVARLAERARVPYVICPAGALPIFGRTKVLKRIFNSLLGYRLLNRAAGWIAVTPSELPDFKGYGVTPAQVVVIPNGVTESDFLVGDATSPIAAGLPSKPFILFMGRLNLIKGPDLLLEAFITIATDYPNFTLVFAGPDEGLRAALEQRAREQGLGERVRFLGFIAGQSKSAAYRAASLLVVPSRSEAMSIVAVEAGACGTAVLMTNQCGLDDLREVDSHLVVAPCADALAAGLRVALGDLSRLALWGKSWQQLVRGRFLWHDLATKFAVYLGTITDKRGR